MASEASRPALRNDAPVWHAQPIVHDKGTICADVIADLPAWFARREANRVYAETAAELDMIGCYAHGEIAGFISLREHFNTTAEIYLLAARRRWHGTGLGRALIKAAEDWARARRLRFLCVKTLGPSHSDPAYEASRRFYRAMGFAPIAEIEDILPGNPCLLLLKTL